MHKLLQKHPHPGHLRVILSRYQPSRKDPYTLNYEQPCRTIQSCLKHLSIYLQNRCLRHLFYIKRSLIFVHISSFPKHPWRHLHGPYERSIFGHVQNPLASTKYAHRCFPGGKAVKNPPANAGDLVSIPGLGRSPGEGNGNSLQQSCLENPMDREAWQATVYGAAKSRTRLSIFTSLQ